MTNDPNFRIISSSEKSSEKISEPDVALSVELLRRFQCLNRKDKLEVIQFASQLASSPR
jgi:hypothetical protein